MGLSTPETRKYILNDGHEMTVLNFGATSLMLFSKVIAKVIEVYIPLNLVESSHSMAQLVSTGTCCSTNVLPDYLDYP